MAGCEILKNEKKIDIIAIVGPTASGKTDLAVSLAKVKNGEIVSADSMQIYKYISIGTAKPTQEEIQDIPYHLIDFVDPSEEFSVADYVKLAKKCIFDIDRRGKLPIICGGTGLYVRSLINNIHFSSENTDKTVRENLKKRAEQEGAKVLLEELFKIDPEYAQKLHPNNVIRIIRALEVFITTGVNMTEHNRRSKLIESPYNAKIFGLDYKNREILYDRINKRVDIMINNGLLEETKKVYESNFSKTAMNAICYKELIPYLKGEMTLNDAVEKLKLETRHYAKRQLTWFRREKNIEWIYLDEINEKNKILERF